MGMQDELWICCVLQVKWLNVKAQKCITEEHVRQAEKHIEHNRVVEALKNLTLHSKLVLLSVYHLNKSSATTGEIYDVYNELCGEMGAGLLTQRRLGTFG